MDKDSCTTRAQEGQPRLRWVFRFSRKVSLAEPANGARSERGRRGARTAAGYDASGGSGKKKIGSKRDPSSAYLEAKTAPAPSGAMEPTPNDTVSDNHGCPRRTRGSLWIGRACDGTFRDPSPGNRLCSADCRSTDCWGDAKWQRSVIVSRPHHVCFRKSVRGAVNWTSRPKRRCVAEPRRRRRPARGRNSSGRARRRPEFRPLPIAPR